MVAMPIFYRGPRATITHKVIEVPRPGRRSFAIEEIDSVQAVCSGPDAEAGRQRLLGVSALASALVTVPVVSQSSAVLAITVALGSVLYGGSCLRVRPVVHYQLIAGSRGRLFVLLETTDRREFDQVCRGLRRALDFRADL
jgi:hypothetical protein